MAICYHPTYKCKSTLDVNLVNSIFNLTESNRIKSNLILNLKLTLNLNVFVHRNSHKRSFGRGGVANSHLKLDYFLILNLRGQNGVAFIIMHPFLPKNVPNPVRDLHIWLTYLSGLRIQLYNPTLTKRAKWQRYTTDCR